MRVVKFSSCKKGTSCPPAAPTLFGQRGQLTALPWPTPLRMCIVSHHLYAVNSHLAMLTLNSTKTNSSVMYTFPRAADVVAISKTNISLSLFLPVAATDIGFVPRVFYNHSKNLYELLEKSNYSTNEIIPTFFALVGTINGEVLVIAIPYR